MRRLIACLALIALVAGCTPKNAPVGGPVLVSDRVTKLEIPIGFEPQLDFYDASYALMAAPHGRS